MFEFHVGCKGPVDPKARRYVLSGVIEDQMPGTQRAAGGLTRISISSLELKKGDALAYWFDFGDDWRHQINVMDIEAKAGAGSIRRSPSA